MATLLAGRVSDAIRHYGKYPQYHTVYGDQVNKIGKGYQFQGRGGSSFSAVLISTDFSLQRYPMEG